MRRRTLLLASPALLIACQTGSTVTPTTLQTYVQAIADGLSGILTDIQSIPGVKISASTIAQIQAELALIASDAAQIGTLATPSATVVQTLASAVDALVPLVTPFFAAAPFVATAIHAALALLPVLLSMVGAPAPATARPATMSPDQAVTVLRANARRYGR